MKRFKKKRYYVFAFLIILLIAVNSCMTLRSSDKKIVKKFEKNNQKVTIHHEFFEGRSIRYLISNNYNNDLPTIVFVHGAPGSLDDFFDYLTDTDLREKANLISIDRLGYGYSDFGNPETSIKKQAEAIAHVLKKYTQKKTVLVGWSYGGPIITKMAMIDSGYEHLVLIAPALSPEDEKYFWLGNLAVWKATKWFVPKVFVVAQEEKMAHAEELSRMEKDWQQMKTPVTYYHGTKDRIVPYKNMEYLKDQLHDSILKAVPIEKGNHFITFKEFDLIKKELISILDN